MACHWHSHLSAGAGSILCYIEYYILKSLRAWYKLLISISGETRNDKTIRKRRRRRIKPHNGPTRQSQLAAAAISTCGVFAPPATMKADTANNELYHVITNNIIVYTRTHTVPIPIYPVRWNFSTLFRHPAPAAAPTLLHQRTPHNAPSLAAAVLRKSDRIAALALLGPPAQLSCPSTTSNRKPAKVRRVYELNLLRNEYGGRGKGVRLRKASLFKN